MKNYNMNTFDRLKLQTSHSFYTILNSCPSLIFIGVVVMLPSLCFIAYVPQASSVFPVASFVFTAALAIMGIGILAILILRIWSRLFPVNWNLTLIHDSAISVRSAACEALGQLGDTKAVESLIFVALKDNAMNVRSVACEALGRLRDTKSIESLIFVALKDNATDVRGAACKALRQLGNTKAIETLIITLHDKDANVRSAACEALSQLGDTKAVESLIVTLHDKDANVRSAACEALGQLGDTKAVESLIVTLHDKDANVRCTACEGLGQLGDTKAVKLLVVLLADDDRSVRRHARHALALLGDGRKYDTKIRDLHSDEENVRISAVHRLANSQDGSNMVLLKIILEDDQSFLVRIAAANVLEKSPHPEKYHQLIRELASTLRLALQSAIEERNNLPKVFIEEEIRWEAMWEGFADDGGRFSPPEGEVRYRIYGPDLSATLSPRAEMALSCLGKMSPYLESLVGVSTLDFTPTYYSERA